MKNKGEVAVSMVVHIIIGVGATAIILLLAIQLFSPVFDSSGDISEAYLEKLKVSIDESDNGHRTLFTNKGNEMVRPSF